ncbi:hypothetical protein, partial [Enterococcus faecalis]|uniref:hypothetical protein n=1 Tax=Enterococcus faecalis TaxID=1351 RepID=UPI0021E0CC55
LKKQHRELHSKTPFFTRAGILKIKKWPASIISIYSFIYSSHPSFTDHSSEFMWETQGNLPLLFNFSFGMQTIL